MGPVVRHGDGVRIRVWVVPGSRAPGPAGLHNDRLKLRVRAQARDGRANAEAEQLLSDLLGVRVRLEKGAGARGKVFAASGIDLGNARDKLGV